jgi:hypothetical protein
MLLTCNVVSFVHLQRTRTQPFTTATHQYTYGSSTCSVPEGGDARRHHCAVLHAAIPVRVHDLVQAPSVLDCKACAEIRKYSCTHNGRCSIQSVSS